METLEKQLGYSFRDKTLLRTALTHSSYANEKHKEPSECYERLEFFGDAFLGFVSAEFLYKNYPRLPEGKMTRTRAALVCEASLHHVAQRMSLGKYILLGKGEELTGGRNRTSILADVVEAIIAAIYLDGGPEPARAFIYGNILNEVMVIEETNNFDYKSVLQEKVQKNTGSIIQYELLSESGPDHDKTFSFAVLLNGIECGRGTGKTKKEAEQQAAKHAVENCFQ